MKALLFCLAVSIPTVAYGNDFGKLDMKRVDTWTHDVMRKGFVEGQIELSKDAALVGPLKEALAAVDATQGKAGGCFPNRRIAVRAIASAARDAWKVPLVAGLAAVLEALKAATPGKAGHAAVVAALEEAKKKLENAGGAFGFGLGQAIQYLKDKDCDLRHGAPAAKAEAPAAEEGPAEFGKLDLKKVETAAQQVMERKFVYGQIELSKDADLVAPLKAALAAVDATFKKAGGCFPNRRVAVRAIASAARDAWKVPLVAGLTPVLEALKAATPGKAGHAAVIAALEEAKKKLESAGGAFQFGLNQALQYLNKDCDLWKKN